MKRYITSSIAALIFCISAFATNFANETLHYKVDYKWGAVQKVAGNVSINLTNRGDRYSCKLTAASAPWADKIYKVRDTLTCEIIKNGFLPVRYEKRSHEGDDRKLDIVTYSRSGGVTTGSCVRKKWKKDKVDKNETRTLTATGTVVDIFSAFYYMRSLPFDTWQKGHTMKISIFSGKRKEILTIKYIGEEKVDVDKRIYNCYRIKFTFTSDGGKKTSDDMEAWIETTGRRIPIRLEGNLPVGKVRCFYTGG